MQNSDISAASAIETVLAAMAALRHPQTGCPWDLKQTFATIAPYTIEEAYEVADAIERGDLSDLKDELGDLLLQVVYHARIAQEQGAFGFADVAGALNAKLVRRHPHVFGEADGMARDDIPGRWEAIKEAERKEKAQGGGSGQAPLFEDVPRALPSLTRAAKLQKSAARWGFDWPDAGPVFDKVEEEIAELKAEIGTDGGGGHPGREFEEFGDLMFALVNLGRHLGIDSEAALAAANAKFVRRAEAMREIARTRGLSLAGQPLDGLEALWQEVKLRERQS